MRIANWCENCKLIWKLQTHMKIANVHVGTIHWNVRIANWYENCKLIWKLQTHMKIANVELGTKHRNMRIANWYEICKLIWELQSISHILVYSSYVDIYNFLMRHSGNENLFWSRKNVSVRLRCGWQKLNKTISCKAFHDSYFKTNSYADKVWFIF